MFFGCDLDVWKIKCHVWHFDPEILRINNNIKSHFDAVYLFHCFQQPNKKRKNKKKGAGDSKGDKPEGDSGGDPKETTTEGKIEGASINGKTDANVNGKTDANVNGKTEPVVNGTHPGSNGSLDNG